MSSITPDKIKYINPNELYEINFGADFIKPGVKTILGHNGKYQILIFTKNQLFF